MSVDELVRGVNIALGRLEVGACLPFDQNRNGQVSVNEIVAGVNNALFGCGGSSQRGE